MLLAPYAGPPSKRPEIANATATKVLSVAAFSKWRFRIKSIGILLRVAQINRANCPNNQVSHRRASELPRRTRTPRTRAAQPPGLALDKGTPSPPPPPRASARKVSRYSRPTEQRRSPGVHAPVPPDDARAILGEVDGLRSGACQDVAPPEVKDASWLVIFCAQ